jgi:hypothetical protein
MNLWQLALGQPQNLLYVLWHGTPFAAAVFGLVLWQMIKTNSTEKLAILIFMGLVLTFPFYVLISSYKEEIQSGNFGQVDHCIIHQFRPVHGLGYKKM